MCVAGHQDLLDPIEHIAHSAKKRCCVRTAVRCGAVRCVFVCVPTLYACRHTLGVELQHGANLVLGPDHGVRQAHVVFPFYKCRQLTNLSRRMRNSVRCTLDAGQVQGRRLPTCLPHEEESPDGSPDRASCLRAFRTFQLHGSNAVSASRSGLALCCIASQHLGDPGRDRWPVLKDFGGSKRVITSLTGFDAS